LVLCITNQTSNPKIQSASFLVGCEFSGVVRNALIARGIDATSCDLLPSELKGPHIQGDILDHLNDGWDAMIAFPPCTYLAVSGARWFKDRAEQQKQALDFFRQLLYADIPKIAIENPIGIASTQVRKPDQIIQPWQHGHPTTKATCLWLKGFPLLKPSRIVLPVYHEVFRMPPSPERSKNRSRTYQGIAEAMAAQWS
jgi:hypothetical protein